MYLKIFYKSSVFRVLVTGGFLLIKSFDFYKIYKLIIKIIN